MSTNLNHIPQNGATNKPLLGLGDPSTWAAHFAELRDQANEPEPSQQYETLASAASFGEFDDPDEANDDKLKELLAKSEVHASEDIPPPEFVIVQRQQDKEIPIGTIGNFSVFIGKAKSRKSFLVCMVLSIVLKSNNYPIFRGCLDGKTNLYFDTEQGRYHVLMALKRIARQVDGVELQNLKVYGLRSLSTAERLQAIDYAIRTTPNLGIVVIDGIKDLITSINDEAQATMIADMLLRWTEEFGIHIITVLHQNKSDNNARGHVGTELVNKSETVLSVTKSDQDKNVSIVEPEQCRNIEPAPFAFEIIDGLPVLVENYEFRTAGPRDRVTLLTLSEVDRFGLLNVVFSKGDSFGYKELVIQIKLAAKDKTGRAPGDNLIKEFITDCKNRKWLIQPEERKPYFKGEFSQLHA